MSNNKLAKSQGKSDLVYLARQNIEQNEISKIRQLFLSR